MTAGMLPPAVVDKDRLLDDRTRTAQRELAELRWHWTLNEDNPARVSFREYAAQVGRDEKTIRAMANGYAASADDIVRTRSLSEHIELAKVGETKRRAATAIADANGLRVDNVLSNRRDEVRDLIANAQDAADRRGTSVDEEIDRAAQWAAKAKAAAADQKAAAKARHTVRYLQIEGKITKAKILLTKVLTDSEGVEFTAEERDLIASAIGQLRAVTNLIDLRITGATDIDWDAELAKMGDPS